VGEIDVNSDDFKIGESTGSKEESWIFTRKVSRESGCFE